MKPHGNQPAASPALSKIGRFTAGHSRKKTEQKFTYCMTTRPIYIGAVMHVVSADSIAREVAQRDVTSNADFLMVLLDPYNTGLTGYGFMVTSANAQFDARYTNDNNGEDPSWNAVWESAVSINEKTWVAELRIPYSELRFPKKEIQTWGLNFISRRAKIQTDYFWNPISPTTAGFVNQWGILNGITRINPPLRLSLTPYISSYVDHYPFNTPGVRNTSTYINGGMDIKYGINESFTLDATLVPDFGQVQSDNKVLNLTPFEVKYAEYRPFFTEGTDLFTKGGLFYSRRIGGSPIDYGTVGDRITAGETIVSNPVSSKLINAVKFSGRTGKGLGIGVFNALTETMYATVEDAAGTQRTIKTDPLTNYNILVLDQSLKNNSSVSLINTNVKRFNDPRNANVTAGLFNLFTKDNKYTLSGEAAWSRLTGMTNAVSDGHFYQLNGGKSSGKFNAIAGISVMDDKYNPNDMGLLFNNNELDQTLNLNYSIVEPGKWYNSLYFNTGYTYSRRVVPDAYQDFKISYSLYGALKNLWQVNISGDFNLAQANDFYESRSEGRVFKAPRSNSVGVYLASNRAKKYYASVNLSFRAKDLFNGLGTEYMLSQRYRFTDRFSLEHSIDLIHQSNYVGYAGVLSTPDFILFGRRQVQTVEQIVSGKYTFNSKTGFTIRVRHYVSGVRNRQFFLLQNDGSLAETSVNTNHDINVNLFNVDFVYSWWFAPGSQLTVAWKNIQQSSVDHIIPGYTKNLQGTLTDPHENNLSLKLLFYLNYLKLKTAFQHRSTLSGN